MDNTEIDYSGTDVTVDAFLRVLLGRHLPGEEGRAGARRERGRGSLFPEGEVYWSEKRLEDKPYVVYNTIRRATAKRAYWGTTGQGDLCGGGSLCLRPALDPHHCSATALVSLQRHGGGVESPSSCASIKTSSPSTAAAPMTRGCSAPSLTADRRER